MEHSVFSAIELLDMAVQIERQGLDFYETNLTHAIRPDLKKALQLLIKEETRHIEVFTRMKRGLGQHDLPESYPGEMRAYLDSFVKDKVFTQSDATQKTLPLNDMDQLIEMAIGFEKRSILFYSAMKQIVRRSEADVVEQVIAEEHSHIRRLLALRNKGNKSRNWGDDGRQ